MQLVISIVHVFVAICLVILVLLQHGSSTDMGTGFGNSASNTMFGSVGASPFLMKMTIFLAAVFFTTSIGLSCIAS